MRRELGHALLIVLLAVAAGLWVRGAWLVPLQNFAFDFSINYTGSRLISPLGVDRPLYDRATLAAEARPYTPYPTLYSKLYLTYIQSPITAVGMLPFSRLSYDHARLAFLTFSNVLLVGAVAIMLWTLRPSRLLVAAATVIFATYVPMFRSLTAGQVDAIIVVSLAGAFALLRRGPRWLMGAPLALAAILKLSPVFVIGPECFTLIGDGLYAIPMRTIVLAMCCLALALEGRASFHSPGPPPTPLEAAACR